MTRVFLSILFILIFLDSSLSFGAQPDPRQYLEQIRAVLEDPLPSLGEILPGYRRPEAEPDSLIVADLTADTEDALPWGRVVGQFLRWKIMFGQGVVLRMPDYNNFYQAAWTYEQGWEGAGQTLGSLRVIGERLGIKNALTGHVEIAEGKFQLALTLREMPRAVPRAEFRFEGEVSELPRALNEGVQKVFEELGAPEIAARISPDSPPRSFPEIVRTVQANAAIKGKTKKEASALLSGEYGLDSDNPVMAFYRLYNLEPGEDLFAYRRELDRLALSFPGDTGIALTVARYMGYGNYPHLLDEKLRRLKNLVVENPDDPTAMIVLGDVLTSSGNYSDALVICMESLERWPDNYRTWWNMTWALLEYAWSQRGTTYWDEVPEKAKRLFPQLKELADGAIDQAIALNPDSATLRQLKMRTIGHFCNELMETFHTGIRLNSQYRDLYTTALNFSLPQWGGSYEAQVTILKEAQKNISDPEWLRSIRSEYVKEPTLWERISQLFSNLWAFISSLLVFILNRSF